jgi:hypothetical protein
MTYNTIIKFLKETSEFLKDAEGGEVLHKSMEKYIKMLEETKDRKKKDVQDLKRFRAEEERRREEEIPTAIPVALPADPPAEPPADPPAAPPAPPVRPAASPSVLCDCRVASGTRLVPGRCKTKGIHQEFDEEGNPKLVCGRHKNAIDTCMEKYMGWSRERGHLYGWFEEGDDTWRQRLSPHLNPFYKAPKRKPKRARPANSQYRGVVRGIADPSS